MCSAPQTPAGPWPGGERFERLRLIGQGALGSVHAALDRHSGEVVALKTLHLGAGLRGAALAEAQARFEGEALALRRLRHPDIVAIRDAGSLGALAWLAMALAPGTDLVRYTSAARLLPDPVVLQVVERLALALAHAHEQGVVHRDIKPANLRVDWPSQGLKIVDFGLARTEGGEATRTGIVLGSPAYMAPEQLCGAMPDAGTDFYALGVTLFQLLTGELPHAASNLGELLRQVAQDPAPDLRRLRPDAPDELAQLLARLLARQPGRRLRDGAELAQALGSVRRRLAGARPPQTAGPEGADSH